MKHRLRFDLMRETNRIDKEELELFEYKLAKYMYELKAHAKLNKHIDKAEALVTKFRNQKRLRTPRGSRWSNGRRTN